MEKIECFACGSKYVNTRTYFDYACAMDWTTECECRSFGAEWFNDEIGVRDHEKVAPI